MASTATKAPKAKKAKAATRTKAKAAPRAKAATKTSTARATTRPAQPPVVPEVAERAVLIPVGAALMARDRIVETVNDTISTYSTPAKAQAQIRRFERRGETARKRVEREIRKSRVRVERELRERRRGLEHAVADLGERRETIANRVTDLPTAVQDIPAYIQERLQAVA